ncbi:MAG: S-layer homology domain-containing protein [Acidimicrobiia bacterium]|nr:S-layer homology domain-containing protein [Acidimicrobiia bacterium]
MSPTRRRLIITLVTLLLVALVPAAVVAANGTFIDDDDSIFEENIEWLAAAGVTKGCNPAEGNTKFCPNNNVTRGQMAAFMQRFAEYLDAEDGTPGTADNALTADEATIADDARTVDGKSAIEFQPNDSDFDTGDYSVTADGLNQTVLTAEISTTDGSGFLCLFPAAATADIRIHASGGVFGLSAGEQATFKLADSSGNIDGTYRYVSGGTGSFAIDWLYELVPGGSETFELRVEEGSGDTFTVNDATLLVEVLSDTRCKGTPVIIFPSEPTGGDLVGN